MQRDPRLVAIEILKTAKADETWQLLGFDRRPKHGRIIQGFRARWKVNLERAIMKELVTALTAAHAVAGALDEKGVSQAVKLYVNGTPNASPLWPAFGFTSEAEGRQFFQGSVATYARSPLDEWSLLLFQRVGVANIPDKVLASKLLRGTAELGVNMRSVIAQLSIVGHDAG